jgi:flagellar biosynthetic protein FliP
MQREAHPAGSGPPARRGRPWLTNAIVTAVSVAVLVLVVQQAPGAAQGAWDAQVVASIAAAPAPVPHIEGVGLPDPPGSMVGLPIPELTSRENLGPALQMVLLLTVLSLAPAILVLCTSFTRIIIVLSLLRQALGTQNLPPNQVLTGLALFMTCVVMAPTWKTIRDDAVRPYLDGAIDQRQALERGIVPVREFMIAQIIAAENDETVLMFSQYAGQPAPATWSDVGTTTLIPAFVLSELKVAFLMGFKVYLPFLVIDLVVSAVLISMGMMMLPPVLISLPFKLLLFVLVDGWALIVAGLMGSFALASG